MVKDAVLAFVVSLLCACAASPDTQEHEAIRKSAQEGCDYLVKGEIEGYLSCLHDREAMTEEYSNQMRDVLAQYLGQECQKHGGLSSAIVMGDTILDSVNAVVFVKIMFGDGTQENVLQPMLFTQDKWMLK